MMGFVLEDGIVGDLTPLITKLGSPIICSPFSQVYRCTIEASKGTTEVAVKVIIIDHKRTMAKIEKAMRRELRVWFRLRHSTIVPLLGIAYVESPLPALVSQWMPFGTLDIYLEKQATALTASTKVALVSPFLIHPIQLVFVDSHVTRPRVSPMASIIFTRRMLFMETFNP